MTLQEEIMNWGRIEQRPQIFTVKFMEKFDVESSNFMCRGRFNVHKVKINCIKLIAELQWRP
jgi:hypothetical protein